jgi:hypothetical protein
MSLSNTQNANKCFILENEDEEEASFATLLEKDDDDDGGKISDTDPDSY